MGRNDRRVWERRCEVDVGEETLSGNQDRVRLGFLTFVKVIMASSDGRRVIGSGAEVDLRSECSCSGGAMMVSRLGAHWQTHPLRNECCVSLRNPPFSKITPRGFGEGGGEELCLQNQGGQELSLLTVSAETLCQASLKMSIEHA